MCSVVNGLSFEVHGERLSHAQGLISSREGELAEVCIANIECRLVCCEGEAVGLSTSASVTVMQPQVQSVGRCDGPR
jgi:hypothetical protein